MVAASTDKQHRFFGAGKALQVGQALATISAILLDGHFVLRNSAGELTENKTDVFESLKLGGVILLEKDPQIIRQQIAGRDGLDQSVGALQAAMDSERLRAEVVCKELGLPLNILRAPTEQAFAQAAQDYFSKRSVR